MLRSEWDVKLNSLNIKISDRMKRRLDELKKSGGFLNISELCRAALSEFIKNHEKDSVLVNE